MRALDGATIVAPATAAGEAGLAVVRLSGPSALGIGASLFEGGDLRASESHRAHHGWVVDARGERLDEALALVLRAPRSYTGEDTVEFSVHGSPQVVDELIAAALAAGARLAEPGEFTRRAFLHGKLDLSQAEAVADLIAAQSRAGRRAALLQLGGQLTARVDAPRNLLLDLLADVEASIDFVDEGVEFHGVEAALAVHSQALGQIEALLATAGDGALLRSGVRVSLAGAPNVGKSSLFNRLLEQDRAIVTDHPGTTRDIVREGLRVGGMLLLLEDTAGLRDDSADPIERLGIERSRRSHAEADVVLLVLDASRAPTAAERTALRRLDPESAIIVVNKIDLVSDAAAGAGPATAGAPPRVAVSAATGAGIPTLLEALAGLGRLRRLALQNDAVVAIGQRHGETLLRARAALAEFERDARAAEPPEILAVSLRAAVEALDEIRGAGVGEEILDRIFARFCIGK